MAQIRKRGHLKSDEGPRPSIVAAITSMACMLQSRQLIRKLKNLRCQRFALDTLSQEFLCWSFCDWVFLSNCVR